MLYKFKSQATGDLIMLEPNGRQMLALMGKGDSDNLIKGILVPADMPAAMLALELAITQEDAARKVTDTTATHKTETPDTGRGPVVSLRQRAAPLLKMMQRCHAENAPIVWGV